MPIRHLLDADTSLIIGQYYGEIAAEDVLSKMRSVAQSIERPAGIYRSLLLFEPSVDMSHLHARDLWTIREAYRSYIQSLGVERRPGAAVVDNAVDANLLMPLWNAIGGADSELDLSFTLFRTLDAALDHLGIDRAHGRALCESLCAEAG